MPTGYKSAVRCSTSRIALLLLICCCLNELVKSCKSGHICNIEAEHVWAADDERCYVFINACMWMTRQCQQQLVLVDKQSCKERCSLPCARNLDPVCALFFGGYFETFANECVLKNYACKEEKPLASFMRGNCSDLMKTVRQN